MELSEQQRKRALEILQEYLNAPPEEKELITAESSEVLDQGRLKVIEQELKPLVLEYLQGNIPLAAFKSKVDGINKRNEYWGFKGIKGQMFFNMVVNVAEDPAELDQQIKAALAAPTNEQIASNRINNFISYVKRIGAAWVEKGNTKYGCPKLGSIPFFLSYFWQIQQPKIWPIYYTNSVQTIADLNLWQPSGNIAEDYISFKRIHEQLADLFTKSTKQSFDLYKVEHVFWFKGGNPYSSIKEGNQTPITIKTSHSRSQNLINDTLLPESYIPPIIAILPQMALKEENLIRAAKRSGTTLEHAFEKYVDAAFTILGYETKLLGQGKGRVPDGLALTSDGGYAILWDAKTRTDGYSMGTDDRTIREYIDTQSRELKKQRTWKNIYYLIVSSSFTEDYDDSIRSIKMETDINEVILIEASALVAIVEAKLRSPLQITLGPDGIQRLFSVSGVLTSEMVLEELT